MAHGVMVVIWAQVLGHDYKATLLELIPEENLPEFMG